MKLATLLLAGAVCALPLAASAQWQWVDKDGRKVFSDQSPPPEIPEKNILRRPSAARAPTPAPAVAASTAPAQVGTGTSQPNGSAPKISGVDEELAAKAKQDKDAEAASKQKEIADRQAKANAETCARARTAQVTMDSGIRLSTVNAKGEREIMDDAARATEAKRIRDTIAATCKG